MSESKWVTWVNVGSAVLVALFTGTTWWEIHNGGSQTNRIIAADSSIASAQQHSLTLTADAVRIADSTLRSSERTFLIGERPSIEADFGTWPSDGPFVTADVKPMDTGKTPALDVEVLDTILMLVPGTGADSVINHTFDAFRRRSTASSGDVAPSQSTISHTTVRQLSDTERQGFRTGHLGMFYIGLIRYHDAFGTQYKTEFCRSHFASDGPIASNVCGFHNTIR